VAKKMTTEMGGKIWAESEGEGKGSTFCVEFPLLPGKAGK
jgi:signal transduction histidine kinase